MAIDKENIRIMVTISREENEILKEMAKKENRSVSNLVATLIKNMIKDDSHREETKLKKVMKKSLFTK